MFGLRHRSQSSPSHHAYKRGQIITATWALVLLIIAALGVRYMLASRPAYIANQIVSRTLSRPSDAAVRISPADQASLGVFAIHLNAPDSSKFEAAYDRYPFIKIEQTLADETRAGRTVRHLIGRIDADRYRAFLELFNASRPDDAAALEVLKAQELSGTSFDVWIDDSSEVIIEVAIAGKIARAAPMPAPQITTSATPPAPVSQAPSPAVAQPPEITAPDKPPPTPQRIADKLPADTPGTPEMPPPATVDPPDKRPIEHPQHLLEQLLAPLRSVRF